MTTTRDRERLDAVAMKTQRMDNSVAPVTGASEGGGKVVARRSRPRIVNTSSVAGSLTRATEARHRGVRGRHVAGHALHVPTPVREYFLIGPEHTDSTQQ